MFTANKMSAMGQNVTSGLLRSGGAAHDVNVGDAERWLSAAGGTLLLVNGLKRGSLEGLGMAALGSALLYRGLTGHCSGYAMLGVNTAEPHSEAASVAAGAGVKVTQAITVNRDPEELYRLWRDLESLPRFMQHLVSVRSEGPISHWVAKAPAGSTVAWDAEIVNEEAPRLIAWRSVEGSQVSTAGSVHFQPGPLGRGTEVKVTLKYDPPGGKLGSWIAWLFGEEPNMQIAEDLRRFKALAEGETPASRQESMAGRA